MYPNWHPVHVGDCVVGSSTQLEQFAIASAHFLHPPLCWNESYAHWLWQIPFASRVPCGHAHSGAFTRPWLQLRHVVASRQVLHRPGHLLHSPFVASKNSFAAQELFSQLAPSAAGARPSLHARQTV